MNEQNRIIQQIVDHCKRNELPVELNGSTLNVKESSIMDIYNFCKDHLEMSTILFRISEDVKWQPLHDLLDVLHLEWVDRIILEERITCHYQPIIKANGDIFAYEILSRFIDEEDENTLLSPFNVFTAAKKRGRLYALDRLCRLTAVRHAVSIKEKAFINFIPTSIYSPEHCLKSTTSLANELGINPKQFVFEVVETEKVDDLDHLKSILKYYRDRGFQYALDDVGEGFSTFEMLKEIKPQYMKLDMKYVQGVASDSYKQDMASKFLKAGNQVDAIPLAEGVETKEDFDWLKQQGFQLFQGYLFGKPSATPIRSIDI